MSAEPSIGERWRLGASTFVIERFGEEPCGRVARHAGGFSSIDLLIREGKRVADECTCEGYCLGAVCEACVKASAAPLDVAAIRARAEAATTGPLVAWHDDKRKRGWSVCTMDKDGIAEESVAVELSREDAEIANDDVASWI